ncbi:hypothetical protein ACE02Z_21075 [Shewanella xiamenensis]|uniref:hypothetical protein n=1 Tax=Shewanella xiamenensis TaxID=332186 RepID=UPI00313B1489
MLTKLATKNYSKIPKHLHPIVGGLLVLGILWLSLSLSVSAKNEIYSVEKNGFLMASTLVAHSAEESPDDLQINHQIRVEAHLVA